MECLQKGPPTARSSPPKPRQQPPRKAQHVSAGTDAVHGQAPSATTLTPMRREPARPSCYPQSTMAAWSPTLEGFRAMFRRPSLSLAEIIWRFTFGAAACVLLGLAALAYLDTLPVTRTDLVMLRTGHPVLVSRAIAHIFHGSALRV